MSCTDNIKSYHQIESFPVYGMNYINIYVHGVTLILSSPAYKLAMAENPNDHWQHYWVSPQLLPNNELTPHNKAIAVIMYGSYSSPDEVDYQVTEANKMTYPQLLASFIEIYQPELFKKINEDPISFVNDEKEIISEYAKTRI